MLRGLVVVLCLACVTVSVTASFEEDRLWETLSGRSEALKSPATLDKELFDGPYGKKDIDTPKASFATFEDKKTKLDGPLKERPDSSDDIKKGPKNKFSEASEVLGLKDLWINLAPEKVRKAADSEVVKFTVRTVKDAVLDELSPSQRVLLKVVPVLAASSIVAAPRWLDEAFDIRNKAADAKAKMSVSADQASKKAKDAAKDFLKDSYNVFLDFKGANPGPGYGAGAGYGEVWRIYVAKLKTLFTYWSATLKSYFKFKGAKSDDS